MPARPTTNPKILLTTAYRRNRHGIYNVATANFERHPRMGIPSTASIPLRFLKQNVPEIEILEFPRWHEYVAKLKQGWDVVGFTFLYTNLAEILEMVEEARRQGITEIWAGGYGAISEEADEFADRVFHGYAEKELSENLFGREFERVRHPPIVWPINIQLPPTLPYKKLGLLFTQRGCPYRCTFCQTPIHAPRPSRIPLESIEEVLRYYRSVGINEVWIADETFYTFPSHSETVIDLLAKYGMQWWVMTRADLVLPHLDEWVARGLVKVQVGVESINNEVLKKIGKEINLELVSEFRRRAAEKGVFTLGFYMIGYEEDTVSSVLRDYEAVYKMGFDMYQLTVLTPYPRTPLWYDLESRYGIFEKDYHKFDARHLVWNHPHISPQQMNSLIRIGRAKLNVPMGHYSQGLIRVVRRRIREKGLKFLWDDILHPPLHSIFYDERKQVFIPDGKKAGQKQPTRKIPSPG